MTNNITEELSIILNSQISTGDWLIAFTIGVISGIVGAIIGGGLQHRIYKLKDEKIIYKKILESIERNVNILREFKQFLSDKEYSSLARLLKSSLDTKDFNLNSLREILSKNERLGEPDELEYLILKYGFTTSTAKCSEALDVTKNEIPKIFSEAYLESQKVYEFTVESFKRFHDYQFEFYKLGMKTFDEGGKDAKQLTAALELISNDTSNKLNEVIDGIVLVMRKELRFFNFLRFWK